MLHFLKTMYFKGLRLLCHFPWMINLFNNVYKKTIIHSPFLLTSFKWKMIRQRLINFEVNRVLYKKGKQGSIDDLYLIDFRAGDEEKNHKERKSNKGFYTLGVYSSGISLDGRVKDNHVKYLYLKIDNAVVRKVLLTKERIFKIKLRRASIKTFPPQSVFSVEFENGERLAYKRSDCVLVHIPYGNGTLSSLLEKGFMFSKKGSMNVESDDFYIKRGKYLELYSNVKEVFDKEIGKNLFVMYGTLLGCVREGNLIKNDDDFDAGYVSLKKSPKEVKRETIEIITNLLKQGFNITINYIGRLFRIDNGTGVHLDILTVWFKGDWNVAYGGAGIKLGVDDFLPVSNGTLMSSDVYVPNRSEVFLSGYYGEGWRVPDPGYVSNNKQTGKTFIKDYHKNLMTPQEFLKLQKKIELEKKTNPEMGILKATAFRI
jgi:hypothetical protein